MKKSLYSMAISIGVFAFSSSVAAALIDYNDITPSTTMTPGAFPLNQIVDGITADNYPFNGFTSPQTAGTITFDFASSYNLSSFILHNDINVLAEGIRDFRLDFFDSFDQQIATPFSTNYTGPQGQLAGEEYIFNSSVLNVSRVDLVIFNTNIGGASTQVEIREVEFGISPVPVPAAFWLFGSGFLGLIGIARRKAY